MRLGGEFYCERLEAGTMWRWQRKWLVKRLASSVSWNGCAAIDRGVALPPTRSPDAEILLMLLRSDQTADLNMERLLRPLRDRVCRELIAFSPATALHGPRVGLRHSYWWHGTDDSLLTLSIHGEWRQYASHRQWKQRFG